MDVGESLKRKSFCLGLELGYEFVFGNQSYLLEMFITNNVFFFVWNWRRVTLFLFGPKLHP